jgi:DNA-binding transcriptional LysR family regulator
LAGSALSGGSAGTLGAAAACSSDDERTRLARVTLELRLLRYFVIVAEELHFGNAAARLYISQPALSQQIKGLEEQVGLPLFVRGSRGVTLTPAGEALLAEARELLDRSDRLGESVEQLRRGASGTLKVGVAPGLPASLLPAVVAPLRAAQPEVSVAVRELATPEQVVALNDGSLDLGLLREPVDDPGLSRRCLLVELLGVSLPTAHPLAARGSLSLRDLEGENFICFPRQWAPSLHDTLVRAMQEAGVDARYEASEHLSTTQGMVAAGLALTFSAPPWLEGVDGIVWRPLSDARIEIRTAAAWRPGNRSPLLGELLERLPPEAEGDAPELVSSAPDGRDPTK